MSNIRLRLTLIAGLAAVALLLCACPDLSPVTEDWDVSTHVDDWRDEVIYQLMVDRFADGDPNNNYNVNPYAPAAYHGGDWQGVIDRLDYIQELGVTTLWITPVVKNVEEDAGVSSYHGYWTQDFTQVNPHFGDLAKLRQMVDECHARGINVILDIVVNHIGQLFYYDINLNGRPDETLYGSGSGSDLTRVSEWDPDWDPRGIHAYTSMGESGLAPTIFVYQPDINRVPPQPSGFQNPNWYNRCGRVIDWNDFDQVVRGDFPGGLKDLNTSHPDVRLALVNAFSDWIAKADLDGFRIDTLKHVEHGFWQVFCPNVRRRAARMGKRNFLMFGEAFDGDDELIGSYTFNEEVDSVFYFSQKFTVIDGVIKGGNPTSEIESLLDQRGEHYSGVPNPRGPTDSYGDGLIAEQLLINFIDNHDLPRFLYGFPNTSALHQALIYIFSMQGIPCVYYGTEQQFEGGNDPSNREDLWSSGYSTGGETFRVIRKLAQIRRELAPLRRGDLRIRWSTERNGSEQDAGIFAFERVYDGQAVLVVLNFSDDHSSQTSATDFEGDDMQTSFNAGTVLVNVWPDADAADEFVVGDEGKLRITVPARGAKILIAD
ncbi:MAG: alpha-amylase family glycosyl hydrolase [Candidatus Alcyoniella australis]|nr:alpha-amylase family glycosyl hydrolase [Candidatus Alcyoniella australis]